MTSATRLEPADARPGCETVSPACSSRLEARAGALERMPTWLICIPLAMQWLWLAFRYRSASLPSVANPEITAGGLVGEGKLEYFHGMGASARAATANTLAIEADFRRSLADILRSMDDTGLAFPVIAKPNLGLCGFGVRLISDPDELNAYCAAFPRGEVIVLQEYLPAEGEAGIFYARHPGAEAGRIIGMALRYFPRVTGDGVSTVAQLVRADRRARRLLGSPRHEPPKDLDRVPPDGRVVRLATIGSTRVGGMYRDGSRHISPGLSERIDAIARALPHFYFGRFDVRFATLDALSASAEFKIIEINGAGSEAIHAWDPDLSLLAAFRIIFAKQRLLFAISASNRGQGRRPIGIVQLARFHFRQRRLIKRYPPSN